MLSCLLSCLLHLAVLVSHTCLRPGPLVCDFLCVSVLFTCIQWLHVGVLLRTLSPSRQRPGSAPAAKVPSLAELSQALSQDPKRRTSPHDSKRRSAASTISKRNASKPSAPSSATTAEPTARRLAADSLMQLPNSAPEPLVETQDLLMLKDYIHSIGQVTNAPAAY